jgi:hypothetical protein
MPKWITPGRVACLAIVMFIIGNELPEVLLRQVLEILGGVMAVFGLALEGRT